MVRSIDKCNDIIMKTYSTIVYFKLSESNIPIRKTFSVETMNKEEATKELKRKIDIYRKKLEGTEKPSEIVSKLKSVKQILEVDERLLRLLKGAYKR